MTDTCKKILEIIDKREDDALRSLKLAKDENSIFFIQGMLSQLKSLRFILTVTYEGKL